MREWITSGPGPRFGLYVHHTDDAREWAYDRDSHIGKLDKGLDAAKAKGWAVRRLENHSSSRRKVIPRFNVIGHFDVEAA